MKKTRDELYDMFCPDIRKIDSEKVQSEKWKEAFYRMINYLSGYISASDNKRMGE